MIPAPKIPLLLHPLPWVASLAVAASAPAIEPGQLLFADKFQGRLAEGWSWVREDPANWRIVPEGLEIRVQPGGLWGRGNDARNVLVRPLPSPQGAPVEISVTFTNRPSHRWEQSNLAWYYGDSHMVKLGQELVADRLTVVMGREENDRPRTIAIVPLDDFTVDLRLQAVDNRIRGQFRTRHWPDWRDVGECDLPAQGEPKATLHAYNGDPALEHWSRANGFAIRRLPAEAANWSRQRIEEKTTQGQAGGAAPASPARIGLGDGFSLVNLVEPAPSDQAIYRHADGSFGWSWDRRASAHQEPNRPGVEFRPSEFPLAMDRLQTFAAELDVVARLNIDRPDHRVVLAVSLSRSSESEPSPSAQMLLCFDWYGKDWTGPAFSDGHRDYAYDEPASSAACSFYRLQGLRGVPPRVNLKPLLEDALKRLQLSPAGTQVNSVWLGNEVRDRSCGAALVSKCDLMVNDRRYSAAQRQP